MTIITTASAVLYGKRNENRIAEANLRFPAEGRSMKYAVLLLALLLSACASDAIYVSGSGEGTAGAVSEQGKSSAEPQSDAQQPVSAETQPVAHQPPAPAEAQPVAHQPSAPTDAQPQPARTEQGDRPPKKSEHNIEED